MCLKMFTKSKQGTGLKILPPEKMLKRIPLALAQMKELLNILF